MKKVLMGAVVAFSALTGAAYAQSGADAAVGSCTVANAGTGGITSFLNEARVSGTFSEDLLTQLAVGLGQAGGAGASAPVRASVSECLAAVAAASIDPTRRAAILEIAQTVRQGGGVDTAAVGGVGASAI